MEKMTMHRLHFTRVMIGAVVLILVGVFLIISSAEYAHAAGIVEPTWTRQFGGVATSTEVSQALDSDGNIYIVGFTDGALPGETSAGGRDVFVRKYDDTGTIQWTDQFGTSDFEEAFAIDSDGSNIYVTGFTSGTFPGETSSGNFDAWIRKYDSDGNEQWTDQFGTNDEDSAQGVVSDGTNVYVVGNAEEALPGETHFGGRDAFIRQYDANGNEQWTVQFGTTQLDDAFAVDLDGSTAYVVGTTEGTLPGETGLNSADAFLLGYDDTGTQTLSVQYGTNGFDEARSVVLFNSEIFTSGDTTGVFPGQTGSGGPIDGFVRVYDTSENVLWTDQYGGPGEGAIAEGLAVGAVGVFVAGGTEGSFLPDQTNFGGADAYIRRYDIDGGEIWTTQFGTSVFDSAFDVGVSGTNVYVGGQTDGTFPGQTSSGASDAFLTRFVQDTDGDSIFDNVDTSPNTPSSDFDDVTGTVGTLANEGQQIVSVIEAANGADGIFSAAEPDGGNQDARISGCDNSANIHLDSGEAATLTCGSAKVRADRGNILSTFLGDFGLLATTTLAVGNTVTFDDVFETFEADPSNPDPLEVEVNGSMVSVVPIAHRVITQSPPAPECINTNSNTEVAVAILSTPNFDAATVDPLSISVSGALPIPNENGVVSVMKDANHDSLLDRVVRVVSSDLQLTSGEPLTVSATTTAPAVIESSGEACLVEEEQIQDVTEEDFVEAEEEVVVEE